MKLNDIRNSPLAVIGGLAILAVCGTTAKGDDGSTGWYLSSDAGMNMMPGIRGGQQTAAARAAEDPDVRLNPGLRWGLEGGYRFSLAPKLTLGAELESGILWNSLSSIRSGSGESATSGDLYQIPILANAVFNYHIDKWVPYVGVGGGLDGVELNKNGTHTDFGPAMQGMAGVRYQLTEKTELGLGYKYLDAFSEKLNGFRASSVQSHAFSLSFTFHF
jgi:opacity protein-like surface antigen